MRIAARQCMVRNRSREVSDITRYEIRGRGLHSGLLRSRRKIKAGMNIAPHPAILTKEATAIVCDNYIVTETGVSECLHKIPKEIFVVS